MAYNIMNDQGQPLGNNEISVDDAITRHQCDCKGILLVFTRFFTRLEVRVEDWDRG